ncbi:MAG: site-specific integrase [Planctomycetaceae bacterium]|nr:site-specific integrase [Planctomycetaceae bacterium]
MTSLSDFVRAHYAPTYWYGRVSTSTIENYLISVERYIEIVGDVPLEELTPANNSRFVVGLRALGQSIETERKHCRHMNLIFSKLGPPGPRNRDALGWFPIAPWVRPPQSYKRLPREVADSVADALYSATAFCPSCQLWPGYLEPTLRHQWWKALIFLISSTAIRINVALRLRWGHLDPGLKYIVVPAEIDKTKRERRKPLNPHVLQALRAVQGCQSLFQAEEKLVPWTHGRKRFYEIWHELNETANIEPHIMPHDLKRYSLQLACRSGVDAATLQALGDHASLQTTMDHYVRGNLEQYALSIRLPGMGGDQ